MVFGAEFLNKFESPRVTSSQSLLLGSEEKLHTNHLVIQKILKKFTNQDTKGTQFAEICEGDFHEQFFHKPTKNDVFCN